MATVTTNSNWKKLTGKTGFVNSQDVSKLKEAVVCVAVAACCDVYAAGGYTVDLSLGGAISTVLQATVDPVIAGCCCCISVVAVYNPAAACAAATGKVQLFESGASCCAAVPFSELPCCAADVAGKTFRVRVIGF